MQQPLVEHVCWLQTVYFTLWPYRGQLLGLAFAVVFAPQPALHCTLCHLSHGTALSPCVLEHGKRNVADRASGQACLLLLQKKGTQILILPADTHPENAGAMVSSYLHSARSLFQGLARGGTGRCRGFVLEHKRGRYVLRQAVLGSQRGRCSPELAVVGQLVLHAALFRDDNSKTLCRNASWCAPQGASSVSVAC